MKFDTYHVVEWMMGLAIVSILAAVIVPVVFTHKRVQILLNVSDWRCTKSVEYTETQIVGKTIIPVTRTRCTQYTSENQ